MININKKNKAYRPDIKYKINPDVSDFYKRICAENKVCNDKQISLKDFKTATEPDYAAASKQFLYNRGLIMEFLSIVSNTEVSDITYFDDDEKIAELTELNNEFEVTEENFLQEDIGALMRFIIEADLELYRNCGSEVYKHRAYRLLSIITKIMEVL